MNTLSIIFLVVLAISDSTYGASGKIKFQDDTVAEEPVAQVAPVAPSAETGTRNGYDSITIENPDMAHPGGVSGQSDPRFFGGAGFGPSLIGGGLGALAGGALGGGLGGGKRTLILYF